METETDQRRGLVILLVFTFFMVVGFDMIMPLVIGHYVNNIGLTATAVSVALAIRQFSQQGSLAAPYIPASLPSSALTILVFLHA